MKRPLLLSILILSTIAVSLSCSDSDDDTGMNPHTHLFAITVQDTLGNPVPGLRVGSINHGSTAKAVSAKPCPDTPIEFSLPEETDYELTILNYHGAPVKVYSGHADAGMYTVVWDGTDSDSNFVLGGFYRMRLVAGSFEDEKWFIYDWGHDPYHTILGALDASGSFSTDDIALFPGLIADPPIEYYTDTVTIHISDPDFPDDFYMKEVPLSQSGNSFTFIYDSLGLPTVTSE